MTKRDKEKYLKYLGDAIRYYRIERGMTQEELAVEAGYVDGANPSATISKIESGKIDLTFTKLEDISAALNMSLITIVHIAERYYLLGGVRNEES